MLVCLAGLRLLVWPGWPALSAPPCADGRHRVPGAFRYFSMKPASTRTSVPVT